MAIARLDERRWLRASFSKAWHTDVVEIEVVEAGQSEEEGGYLKKRIVSGATGNRQQATGKNE